MITYPLPCVYLVRPLHKLLAKGHYRGDKDGECSNPSADALIIPHLHWFSDWRKRALIVLPDLLGMLYQTLQISFPLGGGPTAVAATSSTFRWWAERLITVRVSIGGNLSAHIVTIPKSGILDESSTSKARVLHGSIKGGRAQITVRQLLDVRFILWRV